MAPPAPPQGTRMMQVVRCALPSPQRLRSHRPGMRTAASQTVDFGETSGRKRQTRSRTAGHVDSSREVVLQLQTVARADLAPVADGVEDVRPRERSEAV